jgi:hypothetical protein
MLKANPRARISLNGVLDFLDKYWEGQKKIRLQKYREMTRTVLGGVGVMGAMMAAFNCSDEPLSPASMDLKLYGRLCTRLAARS